MPNDTANGGIPPNPHPEQVEKIAEDVWARSGLEVGDWPGFWAGWQAHAASLANRPADDGELRAAFAGLELTEDGYSLRTPYDGDVDGDGRHIVVGGDTVVTFADSDEGDTIRMAVVDALRLAVPPQPEEVKRP